MPTPEKRSRSAKLLYRPFGLAESIVGGIAAGKAAVDRGGARLFQRWTGEWPGE